MPWKVFKDGDQWCVHKLNEDGTPGETIPGGCHDSEEMAEQHKAAMYVNVQESDEGQPSDPAPNPDDDIPEGVDEVDPQTAMLFASELPKTEFVAEDDEGHQFPLEGGTPKRYVRRVLFKNMSVATAERNANGDLITEDNLRELAATIADMPIADVHPRRSSRPTLFGVFTKGKAVRVQADGEPAVSHLMTDGYFWAGRNPVLVRETIEGKRRPSIEAYSSEEGCSSCGQWFDSSNQYCPHLQPFNSGIALPSNVSRLHRGLVAAGAAIVHNPAGSNVGFHDPRFFLSADILSEEIEMPDETPNTAAPAPQPAPQDDRISRLEAEKSDLEALVTAADTKLALFRSRVIAMIEAGIDTSKVKALAADDRMLDMSDVAFTLVCETLVQAPPPAPAPAPQPDLLADSAPEGSANHNVVGGFRVTVAN